MNFKEIPLHDVNAKRIYSDYISRVKNSVKSLNKENQNETLLEINSHIYEALMHSTKNEVEGLLDVLENLGHPEVFLKELVAEKKLEEATQSFNPLKILKALVLNFSNGFSYVIFFILYLLLFGFVFLIAAKSINPTEVGFFYTNASSWVLGVSKKTSLHTTELLGNWFIPVMLLLIIVLYFLITLLLKLKKSLNKNN